jgi:prepilin-type N-terminal cleavage/methylation domain-containing protein
MSLRYSQQQVFLGMLLSITSAIENTRSSSFRRKPESRSLHHILPVFDFGGNKKGFTLIELIIFIIIGAIILPASFVAFTAAIKHFSTPDYYVKARFFAEQIMEQVTSNPFDSLSCPVSDSPEGFARNCSINYVSYNSSTNLIEDSASPTYYRKITVTVTMPNSTENYSVSTIVTRRPKL